MKRAAPRRKRRRTAARKPRTEPKPKDMPPKKDKKSEKKSAKGKKASWTKKKLVILYGVALLFLFMGAIAEIIYGVNMEINLITCSEFCDGKYHFVPLTLAICGLALLIACFLGLFGATRDSLPLLVALFRCLICMFIIEFVCCILAFAYAFDKSGIFYEKMEKEVNQYEKFSEPVDRMQNLLQCCGYKDKDDFATGVPFSCCLKTGTDTCKYTYAKNCRKALEEHLKSRGVIAGVLCIINLIFKVLVAVLLWFFAKKIKHGIQYGDDEDPEKKRKKEEKKKEKRKKLQKKHKKKRAKKMKRAMIYQAHLANKAEKKKKKEKEKPPKDAKKKPDKPPKDAKKKKEKPPKDAKKKKEKPPKGAKKK